MINIHKMIAKLVKFRDPDNNLSPRPIMQNRKNSEVAVGNDPARLSWPTLSWRITETWHNRRASCEPRFFLFARGVIQRPVPTASRSFPRAVDLETSWQTEEDERWRRIAQRFEISRFWDRPSAVLWTFFHKADFVQSSTWTSCRLYLSFGRKYRR